MALTEDQTSFLSDTLSITPSPRDGADAGTPTESGASPAPSDSGDAPAPSTTGDSPAPPPSSEVVSGGAEVSGTAAGQDPPPAADAGGNGSGSSADNPPPADTAASSLVNNAHFQHLCEQMDADGDQAHALWQSQTGADLFNFLPAATHQQYDTDAADCDSARGEFNKQWNLAVLGRGSLPALLAAYDQYSLHIGLLEQSNARVQALINATQGNQIRLFLAFAVALSRRILQVRLNRRLERLLAEAQEAETEVTKAEAKAALNVAVSALTMVIAPEAVLAKVALGLGAIAVHIVIDRGLGEGSAAGTVVFVAGESQEAVEGISEPFKEAMENYGAVGKRAFGIAGAAVTGVLDIKEVYEGKERVEQLRSDIESTRAELEALLAGLAPQEALFKKQEAIMVLLEKAVAKAMVDANDAATNYDAIKQEIQRAAAGN